MPVHKKLIGGENYLPFAMTLLRNLAARAVRHGDKGSLNVATADAQISVRVSGKQQFVTIQGGFKYLTIGSDTDPTDYFARGQTSFKHPFKKFTSIFTNDASSNGPSLVPITGGRAIALHLSSTTQHRLYLVNPSGKSKLILSSAIGEPPFSLGPVIVGGIVLIDKTQALATSFNYYFNAASPAEGVYRVVYRLTDDLGKTWSNLLTPLGLDFGGAAHQYMAAAVYLGNDTVSILTGFTPLGMSPSPAPEVPMPDEPVQMRSDDGGENWEALSLAPIFDWVRGDATKYERDYAYRYFIRFASVLPIGNDVVLVFGYHYDYPDGTPSVFMHRSIDNGMTYDEGIEVADDWQSPIALGRGGVAFIAINANQKYLKLSNDNGSTWSTQLLPVEVNDGFDYQSITLVERPPLIVNTNVVDLSKVHLIAPFYDGDGYYAYYTEDGGGTWTKGGLIALTAVTPADLGKLNFDQITALSETGNIALPTMYKNQGPL
jgi:hypothetical protein